MKTILTPSSAESLVHSKLYGLDHEECWAIYISCKNDILSTEMLTKGTMTQTAIDTRTILRKALLLNARAIILFHNHPSGCSWPSKQDVEFTSKLRKACTLMDVILVDHIILSDNDFYSFAEEQIYSLK